MIHSWRVGALLPLCTCRDRHVRQSHSCTVFEPRAARCARHVKSPICAIHCFSASMSCVSGDWFGFSALGFLVVVFRAFFFWGSSGLLLVSCALDSAMGPLVVYLVSLTSRVTFNRSGRPFRSKVQGTIDDFFSQSFAHPFYFGDGYLCVDTQPGGRGPFCCRG